MPRLLYSGDESDGSLFREATRCQFYFMVPCHQVVHFQWMQIGLWMHALCHTHLTILREKQDYATFCTCSEPHCRVTHMAFHTHVAADDYNPISFGVQVYYERFHNCSTFLLIAI